MKIKSNGYLDGRKLRAMKDAKDLRILDFQHIFGFPYDKYVYRVMSNSLQISDVQIIKELASFINCSPIELLHDDVIKLILGGRDSLLVRKAGFISSDNHNLPLMLDDYETPEQYNINSLFPTDAYAVDVAGGSCLPELVRGDIVIAAPSVKWQDGDLCVVRTTPTSNMAWISRVTATPDKSFVIITPPNSSFPQKQLNYGGIKNEIQSIHKIIHIIKS